MLFSLSLFVASFDFDCVPANPPTESGFYPLLGSSFPGSLTPSHLLGVALNHYAPGGAFQKILQKRLSGRPPLFLSISPFTFFFFPCPQIVVVISRLEFAVRSLLLNFTATRLFFLISYEKREGSRFTQIHDIAQKEWILFFLCSADDSIRLPFLGLSRRVLSQCFMTSRH